ncbi:prolyl oligopeptidase family serine peptidase [Nocardioides sp. S-58]|uniref:Prolyl oligopeptidase family serine peptidase n=1 Tax=Nocardioides renjunii TaxID=3095075 RepID=A0ABU5K811_9ACTN|nr:prolyl oligopeptidase family serine peptidase [Nocardioides sp. S-58]MDZ5661101.1 prolyl oligopeptidase family serine peptidase [Nocardioides sp. S-58]
MSAASWDPLAPVLVEPLAGSDSPAHYLLAETLDGLYTPYALRLPDGPGPHPFVLVAYGNGGGGMGWLRDRVHRFRHVTDVLLEAGYACAWVRYRTEVELGYQTGGPLRSTVRQGMGLLNRAPLEYEDEVAILRHVAIHPAIDADRLFHLGVSHAGEMLLKLLSQHPGLLRAGVAAEPASHELLTLRLDDVPTVTSEGGLRDIESMEIRSTDRARDRIADPDEVSARLDAVDIPVLVLGRDEDELQGVFRLTYELLAEKRDDVEWRSWSHDVHGYIYPESDADGVARVDDVQREALAVVVDFLDRHSR